MCNRLGQLYFSLAYCVALTLKHGSEVAFSFLWNHVQEYTLFFLMNAYFVSIMELNAAMRFIPGNAICYNALF